MNVKIRKMPLIFTILTLINLITIFTAPLTLSPGTIHGLDGNANYIDYGDLWWNQNPYAGLVYFIGDFNCHQKVERSFFLNDNQMPVCSRCTGLNIGFLIGALLLFLTIPNEDPFRMSLTPVIGKKISKLNNKQAILMVIFLGSIFISPMAIDGIMQTFSSYISNNLTRLLTGTLFGFALTFGIGTYLESYIFKHLYKDRKP